MKEIKLDENLILRTASGDKDAFRELYELTSDTVYGFALSILRSRQDAEDVMHDAYIRIYQAAGAYTQAGKPLAWILAIVRNLCFNRIRDTAKTESLDNGDSYTEPVDPDDEIELTQDRIILETALKVLNEEEREIVVMHAVAGYKHKEIAEFLGMPQGTVLSKYRRALAKLKQALSPLEKDDITASDLPENSKGAAADPEGNTHRGKEGVK